MTRATQTISIALLASSVNWTCGHRNVTHSPNLSSDLPPPRAPSAHRFITYPLDIAYEDPGRNYPGPAILGSDHTGSVPPRTTWLGCPDVQRY